MTTVRGLRLARVRTAEQPGQYSMIRFLSICQNTFTQTIRQPVYGVLLLATFLVLVLAVPLSNWAMGTDYEVTNQKMLESTGLTTLLVGSLFMAAFSASGALAREIEDRTALTVISKPVGRATFVAGKFTGVAAAALLFYYLASLAYLMTVRHRALPAASDPYDWPVIVLGFSSLGLAIVVAILGNLLFSWSFTSAAVYSAAVLMSVAMGLITFLGKGWTIVPFGTGLYPQLLVALLMLFLAVLVFVATAVAASTRLGQVMTLLICCGVFVLGSIHEYLFGYWNDRIVLSRPLGWLCPRLTYFYPIDAITLGKAIPASVVAQATGYCALIVLAILALGAALFERRQLESQSSSASMPGLVGLLSWAGRIGSVLAGLVGVEVALSYFAGRWLSGFEPMFAEAARQALLSPDASGGLVLLPAAGLVVVAALGWVVWGCFGRGVRWAWWLVLLLASANLLRMLLILAGVRGSILITALDTQVALVVQFLLTVVVLVILWLPKTRVHFRMKVST